MHGNILPPRPIASDPLAERIAALSHEYLSATPERREQIGAGVAAIIEGIVEVFPSTKPR